MLSNRELNSNPYLRFVVAKSAALAKFLFVNPNVRAVPKRLVSVKKLPWLRLTSALSVAANFLAGVIRNSKSTVSCPALGIALGTTDLHAPSELNRAVVFE